MLDRDVYKNVQRSVRVNLRALTRSFEGIDAI